MIDWELFYASFRKPGFIPGYEIQNRLGGGAFGEVYKARKTSIDKPFAVKFLKIDEQEGREAIERELEHVRHFAQIDHPNLVTIEDMGVVAGVPYLIMGYAGEDTLARRLKRERLESERALSYFVQCARGVLALHDRRLVHFDLKPSNIFLKGEVARVGDYGLAKLMTDGRSTLSFGRGTPHYMAPEMLRNRADQRADVYSLGVILYEALAGALPFEPEVGAGLIVRDDDRPPRFAETFPRHVQPVVARCLRLSPDDRYPSVRELLDALGQPTRPDDSVAIGASRSATPPADGARSRVETQRSGARVAATELARGAAEVAMGVWDGLKSVRPPQAGAPTAQTFAERAPVPVAQIDLAPAPPAPASALSVPVPPRALGGPAGVLMTTMSVGVEIMSVLVIGPVRAMVFGVGRAGRGFVRRGHGWFGIALRLALFVAALAIIGSILVAIAVALLAA